MHRVVPERDFPRTTLTGGQGVGQALVDHPKRPDILERAVGIGQSRRGALKIRQAPSLMVHRAVHVVIVTPVDGLRAVDQQCLQHRRAVGPLQPLGVKLLHQRQHAADRRGCHAGTGLVPILVS